MRTTSRRLARWIAALALAASTMVVSGGPVAADGASPAARAIDGLQERLSTRRDVAQPNRVTERLSLVDQLRYGFTTVTTRSLSDQQIRRYAELYGVARAELATAYRDLARARALLAGGREALAVAWAGYATAHLELATAGDAAALAVFRGDDDDADRLVRGAADVAAHDLALVNGFLGTAGVPALSVGGQLLVGEAELLAFRVDDALGDSSGAVAAVLKQRAASLVAAAVRARLGADFGLGTAASVLDVAGSGAPAFVAVGSAYLEAVEDLRRSGALPRLVADILEQVRADPTERAAAGSLATGLLGQTLGTLATVRTVTAAAAVPAASVVPAATARPASASPAAPSVVSPSPAPVPPTASASPPPPSSPPPSSPAPSATAGPSSPPEIPRPTIAATPPPTAPPAPVPVATPEPSPTVAAPPPPGGVVVRPSLLSVDGVLTARLGFVNPTDAGVVVTLDFATFTAVDSAGRPYTGLRRDHGTTTVPPGGASYLDVPFREPLGGGANALTLQSPSFLGATPYSVTVNVGAAALVVEPTISATESGFTVRLGFTNRSDANVVVSVDYATLTATDENGRLYTGRLRDPSSTNVPPGGAGFLDVPFREPLGASATSLTLRSPGFLGATPYRFTFALR